MLLSAPYNEIEPQMKRKCNEISEINEIEDPIEKLFFKKSKFDKIDETLQIENKLIAQTRKLITYLLRNSSCFDDVDANTCWHLFEYYACLQNNVIPWHLIPPTLKEKIGIPIKDYGIDGASLDFKTSLQSKYRPNSSITYRELSTFYTSSKCLTNSEEMILVKTDGTFLPKLSQKIPMRVEDIKMDDFKQFVEDEITKCEPQNVTVQTQDIKDKEQLAETLPEIITESNTSTSVVEDKYVLRPYQVDAINACLKARTNKKRNIQFQMACGSGKTLIAQEWIKRHPDEKMIVFVPNRLLLEQWAANFPDSCVKVGTGYNRNGKIDLTKNLYICIYNSVKRLKVLGAIGTVIIDEAHHFQHFLDVDYEEDTEDIEDVKNDSEENPTEDSKEDTDVKEDEEDNESSDDDIENDNKSSKDDEDSEEVETADETYRNQIMKIETKTRLFMSASLTDSEEIDFKYSIENGIEQKFLSDYDIIIPVFAEGITNASNTKNGLITMLNDRLDLNYILAYCNSRQAGKEFSSLLQSASIKSKYFDGETPLQKRKDIIKQFEKGKYRVLVTVQVLAEGIDIPCCATCMFVEPRTSKINVMQCVGRVLRLHPNKAFAHIILPSNNEEKMLFSFLKLMSNCDTRLKTSISNKLLGRINFQKVDPSRKFEFENGDDCYVAIFDRLGEFISRRSMSWEWKFTLLKKYIENHKKLPACSYNTFYENVDIGGWVYRNKQNYKNKIISSEHIQKFEEIPEWTWSDNRWNNTAGKLKQYMKSNQKFPTQNGKDGRNLGLFIANARQKYHRSKISKERIEILESIPNWKWQIDFQDKWLQKFKLVKKFADEYKHLPTRGEIDQKLVEWIITQKVRQFQGKMLKERENLLSSLAGWKWKQVVDVWKRKYILFREYCQIHKKIISCNTTFKNETIGTWLANQKARFKKEKMSKKQIKLMEKIPEWVSWTKSL